MVRIEIRCHKWAQKVKPRNHSHGTPKKNNNRVGWKKCGLWLSCRGIIWLKLGYNKIVCRVKYKKAPDDQRQPDVKDQTKRTKSHQRRAEWHCKDNVVTIKRTKVPSQVHSCATCLNTPCSQFDPECRATGVVWIMTFGVDRHCVQWWCALQDRLRSKHFLA